MHTDIEPFLEHVFSPVQRTSDKIGRVVIEPDYEAEPNLDDAALLAEQLRNCIAGHPIDPDALSSPQGLDVKLSSECEPLRKYVRRITLHADPIEGSWVEIEPPGNWI